MFEWKLWSQTLFECSEFTTRGGEENRVSGEKFENGGIRVFFKYEGGKESRVKIRGRRQLMLP